MPTDTTCAHYVELFWREFEECGAGWVGVPAWKVSVGQPVRKHTSTRDRNIHSNIQAAILLVFKIDVSYSFAIHSYADLKTMVSCCPFISPFLYPVNVKLPVLDCRKRNAEFQSHGKTI